MSTLSQTVLRLAINAATRDLVLDASTGNLPEGWRGTDIRFDFALFYGEALREVSNLSAVTLELRPKSDRLGPVLASRTIASGALNNALTAEQWLAGTHQHGSFAFTHLETALDLGGADSLAFWLVVSAVTNDGKRLTLGATEFTLHEDGTPGNLTTPQLGSNLIPGGAAYNGSGQYSLSGLVANAVYQWTKGANDTSVSNGNQTFTETDKQFTTQSTGIVLIGSAGQLVTAVVRRAEYYTAAVSDARYQLAWEVQQLIADIEAAQATADEALSKAEAAQAAVDALAEQVGADDEEEEPVGVLHQPVTKGDTHPNIVPVADFAEEGDNATVTGWTATASQQLTPAWRAFDGVGNSNLLGWSAYTPPAPEEGCLCEPGHEANIWLGLEMPQPRAVTAYTIWGSRTPARSPRAWYLEASADGDTWDLIHTVAEQTAWEPNEARRFEAPHDAAYLHWRLKVVANNGDAITEVDEWALEDVCETIIWDIGEGQVINIRGVRLAENGGIVCGPGGLQLKDPPLQLGEGEGLVKYAPLPLSVAENPKYADYVWANTSVQPHTLNTWNRVTLKWDSFGTVQGGIITTDGAIPPAAQFPELGLSMWVNRQFDPPVPSVWDHRNLTWISVCAVCSLGGGYPGKLPPVVYTPPSGAAVPVEVVLSVPGFPDATIFYTTNGATPTEGSSVYSGPITLEEPGTIKAFGRKTGWIDSDKNAAVYGFVEIPQWLFSVNWKASGSAAKQGAAATWDHPFDDIWNNLTPPTSTSELRALTLADGSPAAEKVGLAYSIWTQASTFTLIANGNPDFMFGVNMKNVDAAHRDFGLYLLLPQEGVYDLYLYGHGGANADGSVFYAEDQHGKRANEGTATVAGWNNTTWEEGKQHVLFEDLERVEISRMGAELQLYGATVLVVMKWNSGLGYFAGLQLRKKNKLPKVRFVPVSGSSAPLEVAMHCPGFPTAEIRYTTNGAAPTEASSLYDPENPPAIASAATVKAIALLPDGENPNEVEPSAVNSASYV